VREFRANVPGFERLVVLKRIHSGFVAHIGGY
jgi:hypothetical protein